MNIFDECVYIEMDRGDREHEKQVQVVLSNAGSTEPVLDRIQIEPQCLQG